MAQEKIHPHPTDKDAVIREIIPGGHEDRRYLRYENEISARWVQKLDRARLVPKLLVRLVDDGIEVDGSCLELDAYPTDEFDAVAPNQEATLMQGTITEWRNAQHEEARHAA